ncbi:hypothetical protein CL622_00560 [archaeon]|nr:hypothetical protein [archaeon]|tara:strand:+ start:331 stop:603 length:273 start_codon:yes stop_codon:yes gene_type:complete
MSFQSLWQFDTQNLSTQNSINYCPCGDKSFDLQDMCAYAEHFSGKPTNMSSEKISQLTEHYIFCEDLREFVSNLEEMMDSYENYVQQKSE